MGLGTVNLVVYSLRVHTGGGQECRRSGYGDTAASGAGTSGYRGTRRRSRVSARSANRRTGTGLDRKSPGVVDCPSPVRNTFLPFETHRGRVSRRGTIRGEQPALFESKNVLFFGDNLYILREHVPDESVDLVYLDPPFKKGQDFNVLFKEKGTGPAAQIKAFKDTWRWDQAAWESYTETVQRGGPVSEALQAFKRLVGQSDMLAYLSMMAPRLVELRRVLRPTGSIYLHCDPTASHYLKLLMDAVFGAKAFRNEIVWKRTTAHNSAKRYAPIHDILLYYGIERAKWTDPRLPYEDAYLDKYYKFDDGDGRLYWRADLCAAGIRKGPSGQPWRGLDPAEKGMHWRFKPETLDEMDSAGRVYWPPGGSGWPQFKRYRDELKGRAVSDIWDDVARINPVGGERLHFPTQKPEALLDRLILASSEVGDTILDPFCGCGTTIASSQRLDRRWIGIDIAKVAVEIIEKRLRERHGDEIQSTYEVRPEPASSEDANKLADEDKHAFQDWALRRIQAYSAPHKKGADKGIDGRAYYIDHTDNEAKLIVISVKGGSTNPGHVRDLRGVMEREKAAIGVFVTRRPPTRGMREEAAEAGSFLSPGLNRMVQRLQIVTVEDLFDPEKKGRPIDVPAEGLPVPGTPSQAAPALEAINAAVAQETGRGT